MGGDIGWASILAWWVTHSVIGPYDTIEEEFNHAIISPNVLFFWLYEFYTEHHDSFLLLEFLINYIQVYFHHSQYQRYQHLTVVRQ